MGESDSSGPSRLRDELAYYFVAAILPMGASVIGMAWALRLLSPAEFGVFNLVSAAASFLATSTVHWLCQWALRYGSQLTLPDTQIAYWRVLWRGTIVATTMLGVAVLTAVLLRPSWASVAGATFLLTVTLATQAILIAVLQGTGRARYYTSTLATSTMLRWVCTILLCYYWKSTTPLWWALLWGQCLGQVAATLWAVGALRGSISFQFFGQNTRELERRAISYGAPFLVWAVSMQLLSVADKYLIEAFRHSKEVGIYSAAYSLANAAVMLITNPVLLAFSPHIFAKAGVCADGLDNNPAVRSLVEMGLQLIIIIAAPLLLFSILLRKEIVAFVLGSAYVSASLVFPVVVAGILLWQISQIYQKGFETAAQTRTIGGSILWAVAVNLLLNVLLVPRWGGMGAAVATLGAYGCYLGLVAIRVRALGRPAFRTTTALTILLASGIACALFFGGGNWFKEDSWRLFWGALCCVAYFGVLVLCSEPILISQVRRIQIALDLR